MELNAQDEKGNTLLHKLFSHYSQYYTTYYQSLDLLMKSEYRLPDQNQPELKEPRRPVSGSPGRKEPAETRDQVRISVEHKQRILQPQDQSDESVRLRQRR